MAGLYRRISNDTIRRAWIKTRNNIYDSRISAINRAYGIRILQYTALNICIGFLIKYVYFFYFRDSMGILCAESRFLVPTLDTPLRGVCQIYALVLSRKLV